jgi:hypothetical protein
MTTTTFAQELSDDQVLPENGFHTFYAEAQDGILAHFVIDAPNGLWTVTDLEDGDWLIEGPTHHHEDTVLEGEKMALAYVWANGVDRRKSAKN